MSTKNNETPRITQVDDRFITTLYKGVEFRTALDRSGTSGLPKARGWIYAALVVDGVARASLVNGNSYRSPADWIRRWAKEVALAADRAASAYADAHGLWVEMEAAS